MTEDCNSNSTQDSILREILSFYTPATGEADYTPTTIELAVSIGKTMTVDPNHLAELLYRQGFHLGLVGSEFRWQMDIL